MARNQEPNPNHVIALVNRIKGMVLGNHAYNNYTQLLLPDEVSFIQNEQNSAAEKAEFLRAILRRHYLAKNDNDAAEGDLKDSVNNILIDSGMQIKEEWYKHVMQHIRNEQADEERELSDEEKNLLSERFFLFVASPSLNIDDIEEFEDIDPGPLIEHIAQPLQQVGLNINQFLR